MRYEGYPMSLRSGLPLQPLVPSQNLPIHVETHAPRGCYKCPPLGKNSSGSIPWLLPLVQIKKYYANNYNKADNDCQDG